MIKPSEDFRIQIDEIDINTFGRYFLLDDKKSGGYSYTEDIAHHDDDDDDDQTRGYMLVDWPTQLTLIFIFWYLYLSVVFHDEYKYENTAGKSATTTQN